MGDIHQVLTVAGTVVIWVVRQILPGRGLNEMLHTLCT